METKSQCQKHDVAWRLMAEIRRIRQVQKMMAMADQAIRDGRDDILRRLGFGDEHIRDLKWIAAMGKSSAFPKYIWNNNARTIRFLKKKVAALQGQLCTCAPSVAECKNGRATKRIADVAQAGNRSASPASAKLEQD